MSWNHRKNLTILVLFGMLVWSLTGYAKSVEYIETIRYVAVSEVVMKIPTTFVVSDWDDYCEGDWMVRNG